MSSNLAVGVRSCAPLPNPAEGTRGDGALGPPPLGGQTPSHPFSLLVCTFLRPASGRLLTQCWRAACSVGGWLRPQHLGGVCSSGAVPPARRPGPAAACLRPWRDQEQDGCLAGKGGRAAAALLEAPGSAATLRVCLQDLQGAAPAGSAVHRRQQARQHRHGDAQAGRRWRGSGGGSRRRSSSSIAWHGGESGRCWRQQLLHGVLEGFKGAGAAGRTSPSSQQCSSSSQERRKGQCQSSRHMCRHGVAACCCPCGCRGHSSCSTEEHAGSSSGSS